MTSQQQASSSKKGNITPDGPPAPDFPGTFNTLRSSEIPAKVSGMLGDGELSFGYLP